jgi:hypothetical protein
MCETHRNAGDIAHSPAFTRMAKLRWGALLLCVAAATAIIALHGGRSAGGDQEALSPADTVFLNDMTRQADDAKTLVRRADREPELRSVARSIRRTDLAVLAGPGARPARPGATASLEGSMALRQALARHVANDRIIARVALRSAVSTATKRSAEQLLASSRRWAEIVR